MIQEEKPQPEIIIDEFAILAIFASMIWLTLGLTIFQGNPRAQNIFMLMLFFNIAGLIGTITVGKAQIMREFTYTHLIMAIILAIPFVVLGIISISASADPKFDTMTVIYQIAVATSEELFFRGLIFTLTRKILPEKIGTPTAILLNGILFAIYHVKSYGFQNQYLIFPFASAIFFCLILYIFKRISYPIFVHAAYNSMLGIAAGGVTPV